MSRFVGHKIRTKLVVLALPQYLRFKMARAHELLHVVTIAFNIPRQLRKSQNMSLKREKAEAMPRAGERGYQSFLVIFGGGWRP